MNMTHCIEWLSIRKAVLACLIFLLSACSTLPASRDGEIENSRKTLEAIVAQSKPQFGPSPDIPEPDSLHALTDEQLADFRTFLDAPSRSRTPMQKRVYDYLESITSNFNYYEATLPASKALETLSGNCMSLAVLTTALANAAGLDLGYRLMEDVPVFEYQGTTVVKGQHLSTVLYQPDWEAAAENRTLKRPGLQVDYFRSARTRVVANADKADYLAMYYQNLAVENLTKGLLDNAFWYSLESLRYNPLHAHAINTLAIIHRRLGDLDQAERLYLHGLSVAGNDLSLLRNYHALLTVQARDEEAAKIQRLLERQDDASPFRWIALAIDAEQENDFNSAIHYYQRALDLAPYMHEIQLGIALANYRAGRLKTAENALEEAIALVPAPATRNLYEAKLRMLTKELQN